MRDILSPESALAYTMGVMAAQEGITYGWPCEHNDDGTAVVSVPLFRDGVPFGTMDVWVNSIGRLYGEW